ncbi:hypothetical protein ACFX13_037328 [Malus domestica]
MAATAKPEVGTISSSSARLTQQNWWDLVSSTNPWQQQLNQKYSNSNNNCDDLDQDVSNSSPSFTKTPKSLIVIPHLNFSDLREKVR